MLPLQPGEKQVEIVIRAGLDQQEPAQQESPGYDWALNQQTEQFRFSELGAL